MPDNELQIGARVDTAAVTSGMGEMSAAVTASTQEMSAAFTGVSGNAASAFASMSVEAEAASDSMEASFSKTEAKHAAHMLGMNRAVGGFVASMPGVGAALSMAFAPLAIIELIEWMVKGIEKLATMHDSAKKLAEDQVAFQTALQEAFNSLNDKLIEAGRETDKLRNDHLGALDKELQLINNASMRELVQSFGLVEKAADSLFKEMEGHWYTFGIGSDGAKHALDEFHTKYTSMLSTGDDKGAGDLLAGTLKSAKDVLAAQQVMVANRKSGEGITDESWAAQLVLRKAGLGISENEVKSQQALVDALKSQLGVQTEVNSLAIAKATNAGLADHKAEAGKAQALAEAKEKGIEQMSALTLQAENKAAEEAFAASEANIKQSIAQAIQGGQDKAEAELAALPQFIAAQNAFTAAKLAALEKDHKAEVAAIAAERSILNAGNTGQNNAALITNANQKTQIGRAHV